MERDSRTAYLERDTHGGDTPTTKQSQMVTESESKKSRTESRTEWRTKSRDAARRRRGGEETMR